MSIPCSQFCGCQINGCSNKWDIQEEEEVGSDNNDEDEDEQEEGEEEDKEE